MSSTSPTSPDQYRSPSASPVWRARRAFSPREAWKIEIDFGQRDGQVEEQRVLPGLLDGFGPQLAFSFGGGVRFGGQQPGVQVSGFPAITRRPAQLGAIGRFTFAEQQVVWLAFDPLTGLESESPGTGSPPAAGRLSPGLAGLDVVAGRVLGRAAVDLFPDVLQVIALTQRRDNCH
jgi:hypothetical protein